MVVWLDLVLCAVTLSARTSAPFKQRIITPPFFWSTSILCRLEKLGADDFYSFAAGNGRRRLSQRQWATALWVLRFQRRHSKLAFGKGCVGLECQLVDASKIEAVEGLLSWCAL